MRGGGDAAVINSGRPGVIEMMSVVLLVLSVIVS